MIVLGAGITGCLASIMNSNCKIFEPKKEINTHKALLRFRSPDIGIATGIDFKKVEVHKGIWHRKQSVQLAPRYINLYSRKVSDTISARSICNLETENRWIAPDNFHKQLIDKCKNIDFGNDVCEILYDAQKSDKPIISTLPMFILAEYFGYDITFENNISPIYITQFHVDDCDVYQTYYYTEPEILPYRASITGDTLIIESRWEISDEDIYWVFSSFGLTGHPNQLIFENYKQPNGKMTKIDEKMRRKIIFELTQYHNIFSLGRFATWRNLVLDEVFNDINVIQKMIKEDSYGRMRIQNES